MSEPDAARESRRQRFLRAFAESVPHNRALGIEIVELGTGFAHYRLPWDDQLAADDEAGGLHGGAIGAMLDACCGSAVFNALPQAQPIATLDLRIDYLREPARGRAVTARADCVHVAASVAFARAVAYHDDPAAPVATCVATFMLGTRASGPPRGRAPEGA